jgi:hypothetical protein
MKIKIMTRRSRCFAFEKLRRNRHDVCVQQIIPFRLLTAVFFLAAALNLPAQGTAIFYQGQLNDSGSPASTNYDFRFAVYTAVTNGSSVSLSLTNYAVPVANGLFTVTLDFGPGVFNGTVNGSNYWLDIGVRAIGVTNFTALTPRQPILPVPYALFATSASNLLGGLQSTQLVGTISSSLISGTYSNAVNFPNGTNIFTGSFAGNGTNLTNLNGSQITGGTVADARLSSNVPLLNQNQTFTGANTFTGTGNYYGVNTFTNFGNAFSGSFFGNGLVGWIPVYSTATNAQRDHGYMLLNSGLTTVTLPTSASLSVDDIVRVSGAGAGGWLAQENSGQSITGNLAAFRNAFVTTLPVASDYHGVAASADGVRMYAVGNGLTGVYASSDDGRNWGQVSSSGTIGLSGSWFAVACSANGKIVYAEPYAGGTIRKSTDSGVNWAATGTSATKVPIACSADGNTLFTGVACSGNGTYLARVSGGAVQVSNNGGSSWTSVVTGATCVAASSDCTKLVAGVSNGLLYASSDLGESWTTLTATNQMWSGAWMSPDGSKFAATVSTVGGITGSIDYCNVSAQPNTITTNSISGGQGSAVELQYIGNGQFMPVSSAGLLWAN